MRWELATDNQLISIVKHDQNCPISLLSRAVEEMLNRGLFDRIIARCIRLVTGNASTVQKVHMVGLDDFMQIGRMEIVKSLDDYNGQKGKNFISFIFLRVKQRIMKIMQSLEAQKRDSRKVTSYHQQAEDGTEIIELMTDKTFNVEKYVVNKVTVEQLLKRVNDHQKTVLLYRLKGYTFAEISEMLGRGSDRTMHQAYRLAIEKMRKGA